MAKQRFGAALSAAALSSLAGCVTAAPGEPAIAHAEHRPNFLDRIDFSNVEVARLFDFRAAEPLLVSDDAEPSYALPHEATMRAPGSGRLAPHADEHAAKASYLLRAEGDLPDGWAPAGDAVRHRASGLECPKAIDLAEEKRRFSLVELQRYDEKNLDVSCSYSGAGVSITFYASFWPEMSLEDSAGGAVAAIMQRFPVKGGLPVSVAELSAGEADGGALFANLEQPAAAAFDIGEIEGVPYKTSLWLVKTYGWHVKARATYAQQDLTTEIVSAVMFAVAHLNVRMKNIEEPMTAGGEV